MNEVKEHSTLLFIFDTNYRFRYGLDGFIHDTVKQIFIFSLHQQDHTLGKHSLFPSRCYGKFPRDRSRIRAYILS